MNVVKFKYFDDFHCLGPDCKDTCCKDWHIYITKREYLDYKKMKCSPELRRLLDDSFKRIKTSSNDTVYAEVKFNEDNKCPLLGKDSLCMLQKELGENALSLTCNVFPRIRSFVGGTTLLESCTATCYHVVELLMQHPEGLEIVEEEYDKKDKYINKGLSSGHSINKTHKEFPYFWNIINAEVDILQNRSFTFSERMLILGYFCQKADEYIKNDAMDKIPGLAAMLLDNELCRKISDSLKPPYSEGRIASESLNMLIGMRERIKTTPWLTVSNNLFDRVFERLECRPVIKDGEKIYKFNVPEYLKLIETFRNLEKERSYIIENLLVNMIFSYNPQKGLWGNYFEMAVFYNTLKVCAPVFLPENYSDSDLALALTSTVKMILNSDIANIETACSFIQKDQYTLPYAAFLIC